MARLCAFLMVLAVMSYWSTCCLGGDLPQNHNFRNKTVLTLLEQMRKLSPASCLKDRKHFGFPLENMDSQMIQKAQAIPVLQNLTEQVLTLFTPKAGGIETAAWDATLLNSFCDVLTELEDCLMKQVGVQEHLAQEDFQVAVRKYFNRITVYLRRKKHSPCAWEVVRAEVWRALSSSANLLARLSEEKESGLRQSGEDSPRLGHCISYFKPSFENFHYFQYEYNQSV